MPGDVLREAAEVIYLYNPDNWPSETLDWLAENPMRRSVLDGATRWRSVDQPKMLSGLCCANRLMDGLPLSPCDVSRRAA